MLTKNKIQYYILFLLLLSVDNSIGQNNPTDIQISTPQLIPNDETKRATNSIKLQDGFKYGAGTTGSKLTLQISPYASYVENTYSNPPSSCGLSINLSNSLVGEVNGSFAVSPHGQATYNIPIFVSPGTAGMQPNLSLSYVSGSGLGIAGEGFNLAGLSVISRAGKNPYFDGKYDGINLDFSDAFALNGSRLILLSGANAQDGATYSTEIENYSVVTCHGFQGLGPQKFTVVEKGGNIIEFGGTTDSRLIGVGDNTILAWLINKITDEFGNYMTFHYNQLNGEAVIDYIEYTGNTTAGLVPYAKVSFDYITKTEKNKLYVAGKEFNNTQLLKSITSSYEGLLVKKYSLNYLFDERTLLQSISEINPDGTELKPTEFCWDNPTNYATYANMQSEIYPTGSTLYSQIKKLIPADLNGDGLSDMVSIRTNQIDYIKNNYLNFYGGSSTTIPFTNVWTNSLFYGSNTVESTSIFDEDYNQKQEVYFIQSNGTGKQYSISKVTESGITNYGSYSTLNTFSSGQTPSKFYFDINDYTGDGIKETVIIDPEKIAVSGSSGSFSHSFGNSQTIAKPIDFNGDGILEFILFKNNTSSLDVSIVQFTGTGFNVLFTNNVSFTGATTSNNLFKHIGLGDFNGDRKTDFLFLNYNKQKMFIKYSDGLTFLPQQEVTDYTALVSNTDYDIVCPDFNSDGISDVVITNNSTPTITNYQTYFSVGNTLIKGLTTSGYFNYKTIEVLKIYEVAKGVYKFVNENVTYATSYAFQADFNGDGKIDIVSLDPSTPKIIINGALDSENRNIVRIITGLKKQIDISYSNTSTKINRPLEEIYSDAINSYSGDLASINPGMFVVDEVHVSNTNTQFQNRSQYFYRGSIYHKKGKGFLGFESYGSFDLNTGLGSESQVTINTTNFLPLSSESIEGKYTSINSGGKYVFQNSKLATKTHTDFMLYSLGLKRFFLAPSLTTVQDYLNAKASSSVFSYDLSKQGNVSSSTTTFGWPGQGTLRTESNSYTYILVGGRWRLDTKTIMHTQTGEAGYSRATSYGYDGQNHLISVTNDPTFGSRSLQVSYQNFNSFGIPTKSTMNAGDIVTRSSEVFYDPKGRFTILTKNPLLQTEDFVYEPLFGNVIQSKNIQGQISTFKYDGLGRLIESKLPNNSTNTVEYIYDNDGGGIFNPTVYKTKVYNEGQAEAFTFYDSFGRVMKKQSTDAFGNNVISTNVYDGYGYLQYGTEPHFANQQTYLATKYTRENIFNRIQKVETVKYTIPSGSTVGTYANTGLFSQTTYNNLILPLGAYSKAFVEITDNTGKIVRKEFNAAGQNDVVSNGKPSDVIVGGTEMTQTSTCHFNSNGQPKDIVLTNTQNSNSITHSFIYDQLGYQSQLTDPSAGIVTYTYSTLGQLLRQDDATGTWTYQYDVLGRLFTKTGTQSGTTSYQYVTGGNGLNQIQKITGPTVITEYDYDNLGRNIQVKETTDGKTFVSEATFNKYGNTTEYKYPSGFITKHNYNSNGFLTDIKDASNNLIWQLDETNNIGQITKYTYGNGIQTTVSYNYLHQLDLVEHGSIHKQDYNFDILTGNLNSREFFNYDPLHTSHNFERFVYDGLDRLNQFEQQDPSNFYTPIYTNNSTFDVLGNIEHKDDAGDYRYLNLTKPFTLSQIDNPTPNIPTNPLMVLYNDLRKVKQITEATSTKEMNFSYGNDGERIKVDYLISGVNQYTRYYQTNYEREEKANGDITEWSYIYSPSGLTAVYHKQNLTPGELLYVLADHLDSPILLTDNTQQIKEKYSFDAWGRRRNPDNWSYTGLTSNQYLNRGYTFHEHIDEFNLINMNGRVYDPVLGRFIQSDNLIQAPGNIQNFNRYSYVINNPLSYNDPSGNELFTTIASGFIGFYQGWQIGSAKSENFWVRFGYGFAGSVIASSAAFVGGEIGGAFASPIVGAVLGGATAGAINGAGFTVLSGGDFDDVAKNTMIGSFAGAVGGGLSAGVGGAAGALLGGAGAGATSAALSGADGDQIWKSALVGGGVSLGMYELNLLMAYSNSNPKDLNFIGYNKQQAALQRYNNWGKRFEVGGYYTKGGGIRGVRYGKLLGEDHQVYLNETPKNAIGEWHTHTRTGQGYNYAGPTDVGQWFYEKESPGYVMDVYGADGQIYSYNRQQILGIGRSGISQMGTWNGSRFNVNISVESYGNLAPTYGLNVPSGAYSIYNSNYLPLYFNIIR